MRFILLKTVTFHLAFVVLHFAYDWLPVRGVALFSANSEAVMQHMKIAFFAWTLTALGELALRKRVWRRVFDADLLANLLAPWAMFLWYLAPAIVGKPLPTATHEIAYANVVLFALGLGLTLLARDLESAHFSRTARAVMVGWYLCLAFLLVTFTFETPWAGFFEHP